MFDINRLAVRRVQKTRPEKCQSATQKILAMLRYFFRFEDTWKRIHARTQRPFPSVLRGYSITFKLLCIQVCDEITRNYSHSSGSAAAESPNFPSVRLIFAPRPFVARGMTGAMRGITIMERISVRGMRIIGSGSATRTFLKYPDNILRVVHLRPIESSRNSPYNCIFIYRSIHNY